MISKKFWIPALLAAVLGMSCASCSVIESIFADKVVTLLDNVRMERRDTVVPADLDLLPEDVREKLEKSGKRIVVADMADVIDLSMATIDIKDPGEGWVGGAIDIGLGVANAMWPGIAILEALGVVFSRRKRQHYTAAVTSAVPLNGKMELKDAVVSLGRAIGVAHSSESSKEAYEEEQEYEWEYTEEEEEE